MNKKMTASYESWTGERWLVSLNCVTGEIEFPDGIVPIPPEDELESDAVFPIVGGMTIAVDVEHTDDGVFAYESNFRELQGHVGTLVEYYLFDVHERVSELEFVTHVPFIIDPGKDVEKEADKYLANFYGEGSSDHVDLYGKYDTDFHNYSVGYITYKEITKEDFDVLSRYL